MNYDIEPMISYLCQIQMLDLDAPFLGVPRNSEWEAPPTGPDRLYQYLNSLQTCLEIQETCFARLVDQKAGPRSLNPLGKKVAPHY